MRIYLDNAATTALAPEVIEVMTQVMQENYGNPSSIYTEGRKSRALIEEARKVVARQIGASIGEVFFTSGGTESNNMAIKCAVRDLGVERIISTKIEHHCVLHTLESLASCGSIALDFVKLKADTSVDLEDLNQLLANSDQKTMVCLMHSNNELGTMIDLDEVSAVCQRHNALFHSDTVQTMGFFPIDVSKTKINFITGSAHKFHGPKGVGFIYINNDNLIKPYIEGGSQERNMRAGTENIYGIVGLAKALELAYENQETHRAHVTELRNYLKTELEAQFEDIQFNGAVDGRHHYKVLSVSFPQQPKSDLMLLNLDILGISASGGSACSSGSETGSHVINIVTKPADALRKTVRFSLSHLNTKAEIDFLLEKLKTITPVKEKASVTS